MEQHASSVNHVGEQRPGHGLGDSPGTIDSRKRVPGDHCLGRGGAGSVNEQRVGEAGVGQRPR